MIQSRIALALVLLSAALAAGLAFQTSRVTSLQNEVTSLTERMQLLESSTPLPPITEPARPPFRPSMRRSIPEIFWGEFAEDVHDCGTEQSFVITDRKLMVKEDDQELVQEVRWTEPRRISVTTRERGWLDRSYDMELSSDGDEITFIFTNIKVIRQRCSTRAHEEAASDAADVGDIDLNMETDVNAVDTNVEVDTNTIASGD